MTTSELLATLEGFGLCASREDLPDLIGQLGRLQAVFAARLAALSAEGPDRLIGVEEAAKALGIGISTLYRNARRYPFTVVNGGTIRFSSRGIQRWIESRRGENAA